MFVFSKEMMVCSRNVLSLRYSASAVRFRLKRLAFTLRRVDIHLLTGAPFLRGHWRQGPGEDGGLLAEPTLTLAMCIDWDAAVWIRVYSILQLMWCSLVMSSASRIP